MSVKGLQIDATPHERVVALIDALYKAGPSQTEIAIMVGKALLDGEEDWVPAVVVRVNGDEHGFMCDEARTLIEVIQEAIAVHPSSPDVQPMTVLIAGLRHGIAVAEGKSDEIGEEIAKSYH